MTWALLSQSVAGSRRLLVSLARSDEAGAAAGSAAGGALARMVADGTDESTSMGTSLASPSPPPPPSPGPVMIARLNLRCRCSVAVVAAGSVAGGGGCCGCCSRGLRIFSAAVGLTRTECGLTRRADAPPTLLLGEEDAPEEGWS